MASGRQIPLNSFIVYLMKVRPVTETLQPSASCPHPQPGTCSGPALGLHTLEPGTPAQTRLGQASVAFQAHTVPGTVRTQNKASDPQLPPTGPHPLPRGLKGFAVLMESGHWAWSRVGLGEVGRGLSKGSGQGSSESGGGAAPSRTLRANSGNACLLWVSPLCGPPAPSHVQAPRTWPEQQLPPVWTPPPFSFLFPSSLSSETSPVPRRGWSSVQVRPRPGGC